MTHYFMTLPIMEQYLENPENAHESIKIACRMGNIETFKLISRFIKNWDYIGKERYTIFHYICGCGFIQIYQESVGNCIAMLNNNTNPALESPLHWAVANNCIEIVRALIEAYETNSFSLDQENSV